MNESLLRQYYCTVVYCGSIISIIDSSTPRHECVAFPGSLAKVYLSLSLSPSSVTNDSFPFRFPTAQGGEMTP